MGKQPFFDDAALQAAATQTAESLLSSLPAPSACQHVFSELFLEERPGAPLGVMPPPSCSPRP